jgi:hypothetical protein
MAVLRGIEIRDILVRSEDRDQYFKMIPNKWLLKWSVPGSGFKGYKMLISETLYSIVWIGPFHPLDETWNSTRITRNAIVRDQIEHFNREPWTLNRSTYAIEYCMLLNIFYLYEILI